jgi:nicotinamidase-related amidase
MSEGNDTALLVIDVQCGLFEQPEPIYEADRLLDNLAALIERGHAAGAPVCFVQHCDSYLSPETPPWQLHPRLQPAERDIRVRKQHGNAFEETTLHTALAARGVKTVVVSGLVSNHCVTVGSLGAQALGYRVIVASDAHSTCDPDPALIVETVNRRLSEAGIELRPTAAIEF